VTLSDADRSKPADRQHQARTVLNALLARYYPERDGREDKELIDALFVDSGDTSGWLAGISELSISFRRDRLPTVRALSEVIPQRSLEPALAAAGLRWGTQMLARVSSAGAGCDATLLFREIYEMLYVRDVAEPAPVFRFGIATEHGGASPILKMYFDLHASRAAHRPRALVRIAELLGETAGLAAWQHACPAVDLDKTRVIGVDFVASTAVRTKFYWGARSLTWEKIAAALREISGERHTETLARLRREVCAVTNELSSVMVSMCAANGERSMKIDVCVARLYESDGSARDAIERFGGPDLDAHGSTPFEIVSGGLDPHSTRHVQQYLGVEFPPRGSSRVTVYYRPIGLETEHLSAHLRPQRCA
jgi:hypothetical protein